MNRFAVSVLLTLLLCHSCFSNYVLKIRAVRYRNPNDEDHDGGNCDYIPLQTECDVYLKFCIRNVNLSPSNADNCWDTITTSSSFESTDLTFPTTGSLYPGANVNNPVTFTGSSAWPGSFQLLVISIDKDDGTDDDLIDRNAFNFTVNATTDSSSWSSPITTNGHFSNVQFTVRVQLLCSNGWTGSDCNQCVPRTGCSPINGRCTQPGECICVNGYTGMNCTESPSITTTTAIITSTTTPAGTSNVLPTMTSTITSPLPGTITSPLPGTITSPLPGTITTSTSIASKSTNEPFITSTVTVATTSPTSQSASGSNLGVIAGGAVGGVVILLVIIVCGVILASCWLMRTKMKKVEAAQRNEMPESFNKNITYMSPKDLDPSAHRADDNYETI